MSGGHFNYDQHRITDAAAEIEELVATNDSTEKDDWGQDKGSHYPPDVIAKFKEASSTLHQAAAMLQRVDWLVCGDDDEESFMRRWDEEVPAPTIGQLTAAFAEKEEKLALVKDRSKEVVNRYKSGFQREQKENERLMGILAEKEAAIKRLEAMVVFDCRRPGVCPNECTMCVATKRGPSRIIKEVIDEVDGTTSDYLQLEDGSGIGVSESDLYLLGHKTGYAQRGMESYGEIEAAHQSGISEGREYMRERIAQEFDVRCNMEKWAVFIRSIPITKKGE